MNDLEKIRINKLILVEDQLRMLSDKATKLGWKYNYKDDKELIESVTYLFRNLRNLASDVGSVRADLYMEWNRKKRMIIEKPIFEDYDGYENGQPVYDYWKCPNCGREYDIDEKHDYCPSCGQAIDWSDKDD